MRSPRRDRSKAPEGFTLLEVVVVLILLALAAGLAAPALGDREAPGESELAALLTGAREAAARRGETVALRISASGSWRMESGGAAAAEPIQTGEIEPFAGLPFTLLVSPVGTCGLDAASGNAAPAIRLDPLSCTLLSP
jgi:prepilin-type N-terminal cleavage/methylation domain-containing protein